MSLDHLIVLNELKVGFHYPSSRVENSTRELGCIFWYLWTRAVNSGSGNRPLVSQSQHEALESLQKRAMRIIFNHDDNLTSLIIAGVDNLQTRREHLTEQFFLCNVLKEHRSLHSLPATY